MPLQNHVVSLRLAKEMKELGFPQDTLFIYYNVSAVSAEESSKFNLVPQETDLELEPIDEIVAAPLASELGEWLPTWIKNPHRQMIRMWTMLSMERVKTFAVMYQDDFNSPPQDYNESPVIWGDSEANARAKMLIWLAENGHLDPKTLN